MTPTLPIFAPSNMPLIPVYPTFVVAFLKNNIIKSEEKAISENEGIFLAFKWVCNVHCTVLKVHVHLTLVGI